MTAETALITGASSGIGLELARLFAADRRELVLVARSRNTLTELARELEQQYGCRVRTMPADLTDPAAPEQLFKALEAEEVQVDVLVNNAGFGARGAFVELDLAQQLQMIQLNITALTHLSGLFLPGMVSRGRGGVLNVASTAGFQPGPNMAVYYATKAYVLSLSEALTEEVRGSGVTVCCLAPGATETRFAQRAAMEDTLLFRMGTMDAARVAREGYQGLRRGRDLVVPGVTNRLGVFSLRLLPRFMARKLVGKVQS